MINLAIILISLCLIFAIIIAILVIKDKRNMKKANLLLQEFNNDKRILTLLGISKLDLFVKEINEQSFLCNSPQTLLLQEYLGTKVVNYNMTQTISALSKYYEIKEKELLNAQVEERLKNNYE